jgi:hypothetical protein
MYRCNKADDPRCFNCGESIPHEHPHEHPTEYFSKPQVCTQWGECSDENGNLVMKVRCIKIKE